MSRAPFAKGLRAREREREERSEKREARREKREERREKREESEIESVREKWLSKKESKSARAHESERERVLGTRRQSQTARVTKVITCILCARVRLARVTGMHDQALESWALDFTLQRVTQLELGP